MKSLFINPGGIGDQILLLPTIKILKKYMPSLKVDLITEPRSKSIEELTPLFRSVKSFDFKSPKAKLSQLISLMNRHKYKHVFITGSSFKANALALFSQAKEKIGFRNSILSPYLLTKSVKLNQNQYASNMFSDLLIPLIPNLTELINGRDLIPTLHLEEDAINFAKEVIVPRVQDKYYAKKIVIHPGSSKLSTKKNILKGWSPKKWASLIEKLIESEDQIVILVGGKEDKEIIDEIEKNVMIFAKPKNFFDLTTLNLKLDQLAAIISYSDLLVCVDSAPMHVGIGLGKKLVAFFGPTNPKKLIPQDSRFKAVYNAELECRPCLFDKRKESCAKPVCLDVSVDEMLKAINEQLN